jgi:hypothetical protein
LYPGGTSPTPAIGNVQHLDAAIDAVVQESYLVPVEVAQDVSESTTSGAGSLAARKPIEV